MAADSASATGNSGQPAAPTGSTHEGARQEPKAGGGGRTGLLLINLGTPDSPTPADLRKFLGEFLMDERILEMPAWRRWALVNLLILPLRSRRSAAAYRKIWQPEGSPLLIHSRELQRRVQQRFGKVVVVELAMRYGDPSLRSALARFTDLGVERVVVLPLFPQYSSAVTGSILERVCELTGSLQNAPSLQIVPPFYEHPAFLEAWSQVARPVLERVGPEMVFFSFHGVPENHLIRADASGAHCLRRDDCCAAITQANRQCYRAQCQATARALAQRFELPAERFKVTFQSRMGRTRWTAPYTHDTLVELARAGCKKAVILSPSFVADCLETLEELGIGANQTWREHGGELLELVPSLNSSDAWCAAVAELASENMTL